MCDLASRYYEASMRCMRLCTLVCLCVRACVCACVRVFALYLLRVRVSTSQGKKPTREKA